MSIQNAGWYEESPKVRKSKGVKLERLHGMAEPSDLAVVPSSLFGIRMGKAGEGTYLWISCGIYLVD